MNNRRAFRFIYFYLAYLSYMVSPSFVLRRKNSLSLQVLTLDKRFFSVCASLTYILERLFFRCYQIWAGSLADGLLPVGRKTVKMPFTIPVCPWKTHGFCRRWNNAQG